MENNVKTYEVALMVDNVSAELDAILIENKDDPYFNLSKGLSQLSERLQEAAEYYLLLAQKLRENDKSVEVYCDEGVIEFDAEPSAILDELVVLGHLMDLPGSVEPEGEELEDKVLYEDNVDFNERYGDWEYGGMDEDDYPYDFSHDNEVE